MTKGTIEIREYVLDCEGCDSRSWVDGNHVQSDQKGYLIAKCGNCGEEVNAQLLN